MRQRKHFIGFWLDDAEYKHFHQQCQISGLNASAFVRKSILGIELRPRPPDAAGRPGAGAPRHRQQRQSRSRTGPTPKEHRRGGAAAGGSPGI